MTEPRAPAARATLVDLLRLGGHLGAVLLRRRRDAGAAETACRWARGVAAREDAAGVRLPVPGRHIEVVTGRAASDRILERMPDADDYGTGAPKRDGMAFLAPRALTIADGAAWQRLRAFNEAVLATGAVHPFAQSFLDAVRNAFDRPVRDIDAVRAAMAAAMTRIVIGSGADDAQLADDVRVLFGAVQSPLRRRLLGWRYRSRRQRFFAALDARLGHAEAADPTLLARAGSSAQQRGDTVGDGIGDRITDRHGDRTAVSVDDRADDRAELLDQVPHWMFTFTGSGTDLLVRTLTIVTARPAVRERVLDEIAGAGDPAAAGTVERLVFLRACLLETGRLFPPVTRTFHSAPGGRQLVHFFPLLQRDDALGEDVHSFRPDRWLDGETDAAAAASNLFLRGPRACPGRDLILFVCAAALARLVSEHVVEASSTRLAHDPVPFTFPEREARFTASRVRVPHAEART